MIRRHQKHSVNSYAHRKIMLEISICLVLVVFVSLCLILWMAGDTAEGLAAHLLTRDEQVIAAYLKEEGVWRGLLSVVLVEMVQVISIVVPGIAVQIAAGIIYTWWKAFIACYVGFVCGHALVFFIVRRIRAKNGRFVDKYIPSAQPEEEESENELLSFTGRHAELMHKMRTSNPSIVVMISCLTPGLPNGFIPHVAARTGITGRGFVLAVAASSWLQILCNCLAGHFLLRGDYTFMVLSIVVQLMITGLIAWKREYIETLGKINKHRRLRQK